MCIARVPTCQRGISNNPHIEKITLPQELFLQKGVVYSEFMFIFALLCTILLVFFNCSTKASDNLT